MADISSIKLNDTTYNIKDETARKQGMFMSKTLVDNDVVVITENKDLNTPEFTIPGKYVCNSAAIGRTLTNVPDNQTLFQLLVYNPHNDDTGVLGTNNYRYRTRLLITFKGQIYTQLCHCEENTTILYENWEKISTENYSSLFFSKALDIGENIEIPDNSDLNTTQFTIPGRYTCATNVKASTLTNCPDATAFQMLVYNMTSNEIGEMPNDKWSSRTRIILTYSGRIYVSYVSRTSNGDYGYGSWIQIIRNDTLTTELDKKVNKSGDTMTGDLNITQGSINVGTSGNSNYRGFRVTGTNSFGAILNTGNRMTFDQYLNGSTGGERYLLPVPETRSSDAWYSILTNKTPVTTAQGGTGGKDSGNVNCTLGSGVTGTMTVRKIGVFVEFYCDVTITNGLAASGNIQIGTIPANYRPTRRLLLPAGDSGRWGVFLIRTNGIITFYNASAQITSSQAVDCNGFYIL